MGLSVVQLGAVVRWLQRRAGRRPYELHPPADESGLTRRGLLAGAAAAGVAGAVSAGTPAASGAAGANTASIKTTSTTLPRRFDVVVVRLGLVGLTAAIGSASAGHSVLVLEPR